MEYTHISKQEIMSSFRQQPSRPVSSGRERPTKTHYYPLREPFNRAVRATQESSRGLRRRWQAFLDTPLTEWPVVVAAPSREDSVGIPNQSVTPAHGNELLSARPAQQQDHRRNRSRPARRRQTESSDNRIEDGLYPSRRQGDGYFEDPVTPSGQVGVLCCLWPDVHSP